MVLKFVWQVLRVVLFTAGCFLMPYGIISCFSAKGLYIGLAGAGIAAIAISFLMTPDNNDKQ